MHHFPFFRFFLVAYLVLLLVQAAKIPIWDIPTFFVLLSGAGVAIIAHRKHGIIMIAFLLIHILLEWSMGIHVNVSFIIHTVFDLTFLWTELRIHIKKYRIPIFMSTIVYITAASVMTEQHSHKEAALHHVLILGGMLACTVMHIFQQKKLSLFS